MRDIPSPSAPKPVASLNDPLVGPDSPLEGGHLFMVHGRIEDLTHDAAIVPVDEFLSFNRIWGPLLGETWPSAPATWAQGWGRVEDGSYWLVQVGDGNYAKVLQRVTCAVDDVCEQIRKPIGGRQRPLLALPVLGVGRGGHHHEPGRVLKLLVEHLESLALSHEIDIVLVTPEPSVYAAAQFVRRGTSALPPRMEQLARAIGDRATRDELALFIGAGASMAAGLPSWTELIRRLAVGVEGADTEAFAALGATDQAELIQSYDVEGFQSRVADIVGTAERPALVHGLLAGLGVRNAVTTNYDTFYEQAVEASGREMKSVLPWQSAVGAQRWVLKLHGDVSKPESIVLTRRHMVRFDAANRPSASLLQSVLLTKHLLVVGTSLTDDNVLRLAHEVQEYREKYRPGVEEPFGTQLDATDGVGRLRARLWAGQLDWVHLQDFGTETPPRALELLLDRAGAHASGDAPWLLDDRFSGLFNDQADKDLADRARGLLSEAKARDSAMWEPLVAALNRLGGV